MEKILLSFNTLSLSLSIIVYVGGVFVCVHACVGGCGRVCVREQHTWVQVYCSILLLQLLSTLKFLFYSDKHLQKKLCYLKITISVRVPY